MAPARRTALEHLLLGLLLAEPRTGYAIRRVFDATPMGRFSSSPGAIYPALRRLRAARLIDARPAPGRGRRRTSVYALTAPGRATVERWLAEPVAADDAVRRPDELILRFAFMAFSRSADPRRFLTQYEAAMRSEAAAVRSWLATVGAAYPAVAKLALEHGMSVYEARRDWARRALAELESAREETT